MGSFGKVDKPDVYINPINPINPFNPTQIIIINTDPPTQQLPEIHGQTEKQAKQ